MNPDVAHLIELQRADTRVNDAKTRVATFPKRLAEMEARVAAARNELAAAKTVHTNSLKDRKTFEMDVDQWKEKVRKYKDQLYAVKTNEAYKALQHEIEMGEAEIAKAEDKLLERMVAGEEYDRQIKSAEKTLAETEASVKAERQQLAREQSEAEKELAAATAEREQVVATISPDLVEHYQRIARTRAGLGLAEVRDETCTLCRVRVRPHVFQALRKAGNTEIFHCESCNRILYYVEPPAAQAPAAQAMAQGGEQ